MSYESRAKKRRYKRIAAKQRRSSASAERWFLTLAKKPGRCSRCRIGFERGAEIVYKHVDREVRCLSCGEREPDSKGFRLSLRWERSRARERKNTRSSGRVENVASGTTTAGTLSR
jgi:hypothetical protein